MSTLNGPLVSPVLTIAHILRKGYEAQHQVISIEPLAEKVWWRNAMPGQAVPYLEVHCTYNLLSDCSYSPNISSIIVVTLDIIGLYLQLLSRL